MQVVKASGLSSSVPDLKGPRMVGRKQSIPGRKFQWHPGKAHPVPVSQTESDTRYVFLIRVEHFVLADNKARHKT